MASTYTPLGIEKMATGENAGTWGTKTNANLDLIEQITGGFAQVSIAGAAQTTALDVDDGALTGTAQQRMIEFTGTITGNQIVTIPNDIQTFYILRNSTTGSFTVQFKYATGSGDTFTFATTDKGDKIVFATANDGTNPDIATLAIGIAAVVDDTSPQLGGNLDTNDFNIAFDDAHGIIDENGNEQLTFQTTSSAVNQLDITNAATGNNPSISATGDDSNIGIELTPKGTGEIVIGAGNLNYGGTAVTSTGAELNILDGVTATAAEINYSDLATLGTSAASKVLTADANNFTKITGAVANEEATLTDGATISWDVVASPVAKVTLGGNRTIAAPSGSTPIAGQFVSLLVIQDGTGSRTLTWNAVYEFASDTAPTLTTTANLGDLFVFRYNGSKWLEVGRNLALTLS